MTDAATDAGRTYTNTCGPQRLVDASRAAHYHAACDTSPLGRAGNTKRPRGRPVGPAPGGGRTLSIHGAATRVCCGARASAVPVAPAAGGHPSLPEPCCGAGGTLAVQWCAVPASSSPAVPWCFWRLRRSASRLRLRWRRNTAAMARHRAPNPPPPRPMPSASDTKRPRVRALCSASAGAAVAAAPPPLSLPPPPPPPRPRPPPPVSRAVPAPPLPASISGEGGGGGADTPPPALLVTTRSTCTGDASMPDAASRA
mmetsp:Transcript_6671/g.19525  ORF Transcript_6671/g.19525 Transcript_6671/m.19525 type:complete len:256 (+) Transcript_6671:136-903(+)